ncbi:MAG: prohead protease/major capsid protein fusion protein [Pseudomonadota bacterium]
MNKQLNGERAARQQGRLFVREATDKDQRIIPASLSSEQPARQWFGTEVLEHSNDAINLERASRDGLPLLFNHDRDKPIGRVRNIQLAEDGVLRGELHFSTNPRAEEVLADVREDYLGDISVSYSIDEWKEASDDVTVTITRWTPLEASIVTVPADHTVGVGRSHHQPETEDHTMTKTVNQPNGQQQGAAPSQPAGGERDFDTTFQQGESRGMQRGAEAERQRLLDIDELFGHRCLQSDKAQAFKREAIERGISIETVRQKAFELIDDAEPLAGDHQGTRAQGGGTTISRGADAADKFAEAAKRTLAVRAGHEVDAETKREVEASGMLSLDLAGLAREYLVANGARVGGDKMTIVGEALARSHSTSDFSNIMADVAHKSVLKGYEETAETYRAICSIGNLSDFKASKRIGLSAFEDLEKVAEGGEFPHGTVGDRGEEIQLATYGKLFNITRQAIINDDLSLLSRIPMGMGRAAARKLGDLVYGVLINNPNMSDAKALFHTDHNNLAGSGAAISVTTLDAARVAMATQKDSASNAKALNIRGRYLVVPVAMETKAKQLIASEKDPTTKGAFDPNPFYNAFEVIADPRLDAASSTAWYVLADPNQFDGIELAFLNGQQAPYMEQEQGFNRDVASFKVRIDAAAAPMEYRTFWKNPGA